MLAIPIIFAVVASGEVRPFVGMEMPFFQCIATSQTMMADFQKKYGYRIKGLTCAEPRRVKAILGRNIA